jgi:hypothetical protein
VQWCLSRTRKQHTSSSTSTRTPRQTQCGSGRVTSSSTSTRVPRQGRQHHHQPPQTTPNPNCTTYTELSFMV